MSSSARVTWRADVRLAELGGDRTVLPGRVLEWFQEAAAYASTQRGFPPDRYADMGAAWFIKELCVIIEAPLSYGEAFEVETWVSSVRRFRAQREYVIRLGEAVVARGQAEWLYLELDERTGRVKPRLPSEEMLGAFAVDPLSAVSRDERPAWREPEGPPTSTDSRRVRAAQIDRHGHVNHAHYLAWLEDHAAIAMAKPASLELARIEYLADVKLGDEIELKLWMNGPEAVHLIERGGQRVARAVVLRKL